MKKVLALVGAVGWGVGAGVWLEEAGINVFACIAIAVAVAQSWYQLLRD